MSRKYLAAVLLALSLASCLMPLGTASESSAKNVILLIGDGMGFPQLGAARVEKAGWNLSDNAGTELNMDNMEQTGYVTTFSANSFVTDSAPAATAMATGNKTNNGVIGQDATAVQYKKDGKNLTTILELAEKAGLSTGLITTTRITHATPAAFYAHVDNRDNESEIADQLLESDVDVVLGGGLSYFVGKNETDPMGGKSKRGDNRNLIHETGGLTLQPENLDSYEAGGLNPIFASGTTKTPGPRYDFITEMGEATHTTIDVPIMASGPGADKVSHGKMDNTEIFVLMSDALGL